MVQKQNSVLLVIFGPVHTKFGRVQNKLDRSKTVLDLYKDNVDDHPQVGTQVNAALGQIIVTK